MPERARGRPVRATLLLAILACSMAVPAMAGGAKAPATSFPNAIFLSQLSFPSTAVGTDTGLAFQFSNPLNATISQVVLTFELYEYVAPPGGSAGPLPSNPVEFSVGSALVLEANLTMASLPRGSSWTGSIPVHVSSDVPAGTYGVRDQAVFHWNGTGYRVASRGYFTESQWNNATKTSNGTPTLNLTRLGVAGVTPETALFVSNPTALDAVLYTLLGGAVGLVGVAAYLWWRRAGSSSGAREPERNKAAESA